MRHNTPSWTMVHSSILLALCAAATFAFSMQSAGANERLEWIKVSKNKKSFVHAKSGKPFTPWGFNYDHDGMGGLIEDYWHDGWNRVESDFKEMKQLGANVVRIHLQLGKFMKTPTQPNDKNLKQLGKLLKLAEELRMYLDITGLGCYHKKDVPPWYDKLDEQDRWDVQARFWEAVAKRCVKSPAVFSYDLMNEPVVPGGNKKRDDWLGPGFGDKYFVQFIALEQKKRPRHEIAREWINHLVAAIRKHDSKHLITVGMVPWSLDRPGLTSGFIPSKVAGKLDFIAMHIYPDGGKVEEAMKTLKGFDIGKPVVIEEMFPLRCGMPELEKFIKQSKTVASGWIGFYWGKTPEQLRPAKTIGEAITLQWLEYFQKNAKLMKSGK